MRRARRDGLCGTRNPAGGAYLEENLAQRVHVRAVAERTQERAHPSLLHHRGDGPRVQRAGGEHLLQRVRHDLRGQVVHVGLQHEERLHAHASSRGRLREVPRRVCVVGRAPRRSPGASGTRGCSPRSVVPRADVRARGTHRASETLTGHALSQEAARGEPLRATHGGGHAGSETARRERGRVRTL